MSLLTRMEERVVLFTILIARMTGDDTADKGKARFDSIIIGLCRDSSNRKGAVGRLRKRLEWSSDKRNSGRCRIMRPVNQSSVLKTYFAGFLAAGCGGESFSALGNCCGCSCGGCVHGDSQYS